MDSLHTDTAVAQQISPLVSVIMPLFNSERYLAEAIQSVLAQTFTNYEFIIVSEFGNSKESLQILASFSDPRIRVIQNTKKLGFVPSLNLAIKEARGKYLARIDADDLYQPETLASLSSFLETHHNIFLCYARQQTPFGMSSPFVETPQKIKARLLFLWHMNHPMMWRRKEFIEHGVFFDEKNAMEDFALFSELAFAFDYAQLNEFLYIYRMTDESITNKKIDILCLNTRTIILKNLARLGVAIPEEDVYLFQLWNKPLHNCPAPEKKRAIRALKKHLFAILLANNARQLYMDEALLEACCEKYHDVTGKKLFDVIDILKPEAGLENMHPNKSRAVFDLWLWQGKNIISRALIRLLRPFYHRLKAWLTVTQSNFETSENSSTQTIRHRIRSKISMLIMRSLRYLRRF